MTTSGNNQTGTAEIILAIILVFLIGHLLLSSLGLVPSEVSVFNNQVTQAIQRLHTVRYVREPTTIQPKATSTRQLPQAPEPAPQDAGQAPERIIIDKINVDAPIANPDTATIPVLDKALKKGVVHYPGSGRIGGSRPMFLFGHSSRLPVVQNQAFRSFNGLEELSVGDTVTVEGGEQSVVYTVTSVRVVDKDEALVDFSGDNATLTLSTCTTFGTKENRVVVRARRR